MSSKFFNEVELKFLINDLLSNPISIHEAGNYHIAKFLQFFTKKDYEIILFKQQVRKELEHYFNYMIFLSSAEHHEETSRKNLDINQKMQVIVEEYVKQGKISQELADFLLLKNPRLEPRFSKFKISKHKENHYFNCASCRGIIYCYTNRFDSELCKQFIDFYFLKAQEHLDQVKSCEAGKTIIEDNQVLKNLAKY
ncbi:hypothetical protein [Campylobacter sp. CCUG 57310]|uniref:hypothetical protein n=1 Tax=Campylobacter sp. CCUG 57310 TaxID=2517362 RepID=UPI00156745A4|nr:hypothetical protein [Campylobacter sp. CCUG 57310]QKF93191.1 hypothetical protein CORI_a005 [Campylobacter sp. CCUG 57310]